MILAMATALAVVVQDRPLMVDRPVTWEPGDNLMSNPLLPEGIICQDLSSILLLLSFHDNDLIVLLYSPLDLISQKVFRYTYT